MPPKPTVLAFDTSAAHCAAALLSGGRIVSSRTEAMARGQGERLMVLLGEILDDAGLIWSDLDAIGVGIGPGNFTGIRISVAAARGLALALDIPAIGVSALAAQAYGIAGVRVSSLDARQNRLYVQVLGAGDGAAPVHCTIDDLPPIPARAEPACIGHRADEIAALCAGQVADANMPIGDAIALIAAARIGSSRDRPAPMYIRAADAAPPRQAAPVILP